MRPHKSPVLGPGPYSSMISCLYIPDFSFNFSLPTRLHLILHLLAGFIPHTLKYLASHYHSADAGYWQPVSNKLGSPADQSLKFRVSRITNHQKKSKNNPLYCRLHRSLTKTVTILSPPPLISKQVIVYFPTVSDKSPRNNIAKFIMYLNRAQIP